MPIDKKINILVTGCGGDIGQSIGKILLRCSFTNNLYGIDISDKNPAQFIYPNFSIGLPYTDSNYFTSLQAFVEEHDIHIVIPIAEPELRYYSNHNRTDQIGKAKLIMASWLAMEVGFDKLKTAEYLKSLKLPFPRTTLVANVTEVQSFPVILKSRTGSGSKSVLKVDSQEAFDFYTRKNVEEIIMQEYISEDNGEYTCGLFRSSDGEIRSQIFKRELRGGYSGYGEVVENKSITELLNKLAQSLELVGSINVQLRIDDNLPKIFEINPRFSSTVFYRHMFGFQDVIWSIEDKLGYHISDNRRHVIGKKFYKGYEEYIS